MGGKPWHHREIETLKKMWPLQPLNEVHAALPNRPRDAINNMAAYRKIRRFPEARRPNWGPRKSLPPVIIQLRRAREGQGLTQSQLAKRIGVDRVHIQKWENLWNRPRFQMLIDWANALGFELSVKQTKFRTFRSATETKGEPT